MYLKIKCLDLIDLIKEHGVNNERLAHIILDFVEQNYNLPKTNNEQIQSLHMEVIRQFIMHLKQLCNSNARHLNRTIETNHISLISI